MERGDLVPDEITIRMIRERLGRGRRARRVHPRRLPAQPRAGGGARRDAARDRPRPRRDLLLRPRRRDGEVSARSAARTRRGGPTTRRRRSRTGSSIYHEQTEPVVEYYRTTGKLVPLHAARPVEEVFAEIQRRFEIPWAAPHDHPQVGAGDREDGRRGPRRRRDDRARRRADRARDHDRRARPDRRRAHPLARRRARRRRTTGATRRRSASRRTTWSCTGSPAPTRSRTAT